MEKLSKYDNGYEKIRVGDILKAEYKGNSKYRSAYITYYKVLKKENNGILIQYISGTDSYEYGKKLQWVRITYIEGHLTILTKDEYILEML